MLIGYARVSTRDQVLDRQIRALQDANCSVIYEEKLSGKNLSRPELAKAIKSMRPGDVLVIAEWDRATRSMYDGIDLMKQIHENGCLVKVLDRPALDLSTPIGQGFLAFLSAMAQDERERIVKRTRDGLAAAKARGVKLGPRFKLSQHQMAVAREMICDGKSYREIGATLGVSHASIGRLTKR